MKVTVKLFALLGRYLPPGAAGNQAAVEVADGATPVTVMDSLNLPREYRHLVLVNGHYVEPGERDSLALKENDVLAVWPPVAGG
jgi:sulfur carrier protein ThiS